MPYDLSDEEGGNKPHAPSTTPQPSGRASDIFRSPSTADTSGQESFFLSRPLTAADNVVSNIFSLALVAFLLGLAYLLFGVWSAMLAEPHFSHVLGQADRVRLIGNINTVKSEMEISGFIALISIIFLQYHQEFLGYALILVAVFMDYGVPLITSFVLTATRSRPSSATALSIGIISHLAWIAAIPGILLIGLDLVRRSMNGLEQAKVRRSKLRYGQNTVTHAKRKNVFLGTCWNMPYCREAAAKKCPVHQAGKGPCWRKKAGCMCDEKISVIATTPGDWRASVAGAVSNMEGDPLKPKSKNPLLGLSDGINRTPLTWAERSQRCRECVIYNTHQEQKYKALATVVVAGVLGSIGFYYQIMVAWVATAILSVNVAFKHFSMDTGGGQNILNATAGETGGYFVLAVLGLLLITKLLQLVEYLCFTLKV